MNEPRESDIEKVIRQEELLVFKSFDESDAWNLGIALRLEAEKYPAGVAIDMRRSDVGFIVSPAHGEGDQVFKLPRLAGAVDFQTAQVAPALERLEHGQFAAWGPCAAGHALAPYI